MLKQFTSAAVLSAGLALPASAATLTETYTTVLTADPLADQGSLFASMVAYSRDFDGITGSAAEVSRSRLGFGVRGTTRGVGNREGNRIGGGEALAFTFGETVSLDLLTLSTQNSAAQSYSIFVDGTISSVNLAALSDGNVTGGVTLDLSGLSLSGTTFAIQSTSNGKGSQGIRVMDLTVSAAIPQVFAVRTFAFPQQTSLSTASSVAVPLPATAPMLIGALGLGAMALRRRKKP